MEINVWGVGRKICVQATVVCINFVTEKDLPENIASNISLKLMSSAILSVGLQCIDMIPNNVLAELSVLTSPRFLSGNWELYTSESRSV